MSSEQGGRTVRGIQAELDSASNTSSRQPKDRTCLWSMVGVTSVATAGAMLILVLTHPLPVQSRQHHNASLNDIGRNSVRRGPIDQGRN